ncbi:MAG TPA: helix-turn-helix domain-containing protein [Acidimicrobiales bacterium]|nr:helix-turn-helix domain-containing protein [Acidimicrobiales bacterium]
MPSAVVVEQDWPDDPEVAALLDDVVAELRADPDAMVQAVLAGMRREVPTYAALSEDDSRVVAQGVVHTVTTFIGLLAERRRLTPEEVEGIVAIGTVRAAQGVPPEDMLAAVRVALRWGWAHMLDRAAARPVTDAMPSAIGRLGAEAFEYMQQAAAAMAKGANEHARKGLMAQARAQRELVEEVLSGAFGSEHDALRLAAALDVDLVQPFVVLQLGLAGPAAPAIDPLRRIKERVAEAVPAAFDGSLRADPVLHAVFVVPAEQAEAALTCAVATAEDDGVLVLPSPPVEGPAALHAAYRRGCEVLAVARRAACPPGVVDARQLTAHRLLSTADPASARAFVDDVLGPVLALPPGRRRRLLQALEATLWAEGTMQSAGDRLGLHSKTISVRLRDVERYTGLRADRADELLLLEVAFVLFRLFDQS